MEDDGRRATCHHGKDVSRNPTTEPRMDMEWLVSLVGLVEEMEIRYVDVFGNYLNGDNLVAYIVIG